MSRIRFCLVILIILILPSAAQAGILNFRGGIYTDIQRDRDWRESERYTMFLLETSYSTPDLKAAFDNVLSEGAKFVRLDISLVPVSSSSGISSILVLYKKLKKMDGVLEIKGISENLFEMFKSLKIDQFIKISEN